MRQRSFNVVHLAVALFVVIVALTIVLALGHSTKPDRHHHHRSQLRGIHQSMVIYAQSNKAWFPGIDSDGSTVDLSVQYRFKTLIENDYFTADYVVSHLEDYGNPITEWDMKGPFSASHYSYALLQVPEAGARRDDWKESLNSQAIVASDRNTGTQKQPRSLYNESPREPWRGNVLWNDNHVSFEPTDAYETRYGRGELIKDDRLFESTGTDDALLIHSGN